MEQEENYRGGNRIIHEDISFIIELGLMILLLLLSVSHKTNPALVLLIICTHILIIKKTNYIHEKIPAIPAHFIRGMYGVVFIIPFFTALVYFTTWFLEGMSVEAVYRSEMSVIYITIIGIWMLFSSLHPIGLYFSFSIMGTLINKIVYGLGLKDQPLILVPAAITLIVFSVLLWFHQTVTLISAIREREHFDGKEKQFKQFAIGVLIVNLVISLILILYENEITSSILSIVVH